MYNYGEGKIVDKALIKETGEVLDIDEITMTVYYNTTHCGRSITGSPSILEEYKFDLKDKDAIYYKLSNGEKYNENEIVVGVDNIRDFRINNIGF